MSEFRVPVIRVRNIEEIPGADQIELAVVGDYRSVVQKGKFKPGDLGVYIPEAALLPAKLIDQLGLTGRLAGPEMNRVKAIKLRGCLSQGILYKPERELAKEGDDVSAFLGVTKYEPTIPAHMEGEIAAMHGMTLHFDVENFKAYPDVLQEGEEVEFTEKVHGTFVAITRIPGLEHPDMIGGDTLVYSKGYGAKGLVFKDNEANANNLYVRLVKEFNIRERIVTRAQAPHESVQPITLLGEIYGAGVQDLQYGLKKPHFMMFDIYVGKPGHGYFGNRYLLESVALRMGLARVPVLYRGPYSRKLLDEQTSGHSVAGNSAHIREGIVITPVSERHDPQIGRVILKSVSADYLLRKGNTSEYN